MPSRLKSLELHGYKTFAARTEFTFAEMITAIVGPNGSGKSNIADAIRWVLGEQSYSLLRAKKTEDMIFSGSEQKPRSGMASASIVFDNSDGWLPIDFVDVAITRRAYRDGQNEYLINGQRVRLRDVSELLAQSGLAERTYTIIGQGLVDAALALRAEERRRLFEEAAGIGLHRSRKEEALRRLDNTRRNLERVQDILAELLPRLRSLERQARRVREYEQARADLHLVLREWYGYHWHRIQKELAESQSIAHNQEVTLEKTREKQENLNQEMVNLIQKISTQRDQLTEWHHELSDLHSRQEQVGRDLVVEEERSHSFTTQKNDIASEINRLEEEAGLQNEALMSSEEQIRILQADLSEAVKTVDEIQLDLQEKQSLRDEAENRVQAVRQNLSSLTSRKEHLMSRIGERKTLTERNRSLRIERKNAHQTATKAKVQAEKSFKQAQEALKQLEAQHSRAQEKIPVLQNESGHLEREKKEYRDAHANIKTDIASLMAQLNVLDQADRSLAGYSSGAQLLLQAGQQSRLEGVAGTLSSLIEVEAEYEVAVASALGEFLNSVLFSDNIKIDEALKMLEGTQSRSALLPLEVHFSDSKNRIPDFLSQEDGIIGVASDLVLVPEHLQPAIQLLLGKVLVVKNRPTARRLVEAFLNQDIPGWRVVTIKGEVFHPTGGVLAGQEGKPGILARTRERRELQGLVKEAQKSSDGLQYSIDEVDERIREIQSEQAKIEDEIRVISRQLNKARNDLSKADLDFQKAHQDDRWHADRLAQLENEISSSIAEIQDMEQESSCLDEKIGRLRNDLHNETMRSSEVSLDDIQDQLALWKTRQAVARRALSDALQRKQELQETYHRTKKGFDGLENRSEAISVQLKTLLVEKEKSIQDERKVSQQISICHEKIKPAEEELRKLEKLYSDLQTRESLSRQVLSNTEHQHAQARITLARRQEAVASLQDRIEDDFGLVSFRFAENISGQTTLPLEGLVEQLPVVPEIPAELEGNVRRYRAQLRRLGPINPEIQEEYIQVRDRYEFLTEQVADLRKAEEDIKEVIAELDILMEREFGKTFNAVAQEFRQIFTRLFGGGSARLVLTAPDNMAETGIDIEARLPGRREQGLSLLSGGERSLTAAALVFSLLRVSPTPFCVLDEVDAMLDEANVGRFRDLLSELSQATQFVIVTHNRNTVQAADVIYGVTMGQDSTSQVISLKLDDVDQVVEN